MSLIRPMHIPIYSKNSDPNMVDPHVHPSGFTIKWVPRAKPAARRGASGGGIFCHPQMDSPLKQIGFTPNFAGLFRKEKTGIFGMMFVHDVFAYIFAIEI